MFRRLFRSSASQEDLEELESTIEELQEEVDGHDQDLNQLLDMIEDLKQVQEEQGETLEEVEEDTRRLDNVVSELREEVLEDQKVELKGMEQEIFKILMRAEEPLKYEEIGERMEKERTANQVRPKLIDLKEKVQILEDKDGRAKVFFIPSKVKKDYLEKGELAEVDEEL